VTVQGTHTQPTLISGRKTVAAAATPEALSASKIVVHHVDIQALSTNTNPLTIGASGVDHGTQSGVRLTANAGITLYDVDLATVFVDVQTDGEGVAYVAVQK
jgi:hypothetical protein